MKLAVRLFKNKDIRGRIMSVKAQFGNWEAEGKTEKEAESALLALVLKLATEDSDPIVRIDPQDGHVWLAYRMNRGEWCYTHCRKASGPIGYAAPSGYTMGREMTDRKGAMEAMDRHLVSLLPADVQEVIASPKW